MEQMINFCPWCGSKATLIELDGGPGIGIESWYVKCDSWDCGACGPSGSCADYVKGHGWGKTLKLDPVEAIEIGKANAISKWNALPTRKEMKLWQGMQLFGEEVVKFYLKHFPDTTTPELLRLEKIIDQLKDIQNSK